MSASLRPAEPADVPLILRFIRELAEYEKLTQELRVSETDLHVALFGEPPRAHALIAEIGAEPVGYALWYHRFSSFAGRSNLFVEDVYVIAERRGGGVGRAMFRHLAERAIAESCDGMQWVVLDWNAPSIGFYRGLGAKPVRGWTTYAIEGTALAALAS